MFFFREFQLIVSAINDSFFIIKSIHTSFFDVNENQTSYLLFNNKKVNECFKNIGLKTFYGKIKK